jgi:hypothetical protein
VVAAESDAYKADQDVGGVGDGEVVVRSRFGLV